jgi:hypothetical protein
MDASDDRESVTRVPYFDVDLSGGSSITQIAGSSVKAQV